MDQSPRPRFHVPNCIARHSEDLSACDRLRKSLVDIPGWPDPLVLAASDMASVYLLDMTDFICNADVCPAVRENMLVWRDSHHMTATFARSLAPYFIEEMDALVITYQ